MEKIWIIKKRRQTRNFRIYRNLDELIKEISKEKDDTIYEFELKSKFNSSDFFKERERDLQLRSILDDLSESEINIGEFIELFSKYAEDGVESRRDYRIGGTTDKKTRVLNLLTKYRDNVNLIKKLIVKDKKYFIMVSDTLEWYQSLLKIHNFMDPFNRWRYSYAEKKKIRVEIPKINEENFYKAKQLNKVKKK